MGLTEANPTLHNVSAITMAVMVFVSIATAQDSIRSHGAVSAYLFSHESGFHADTSQFELVDTEFFGHFFDFNWWPSFIGGDLFLSGEIYGLHLTGTSSLTAGAGPGAELRVGPMFIGVIIGWSGDEGIHGLHGMYDFTTLYTGATIRGYRMEIGEVLGDNSDWTDLETPHATYVSAFLGVSKRWSHIVFFEPEFKVMFPIVAHYWIGDNANEFVSAVERYHLGDLYFALSVKLAIGFY